jgi:hypothetical protein
MTDREGDDEFNSMHLQSTTTTTTETKGDGAGKPLHLAEQ